MSKANSEDRLDADELPNRLDGIWHPLRISGTIGQKDAIGIALQYFGGRRMGGHDGDAAAHVHQLTEDIALDAKVVGHDVKARRVVGGVMAVPLRPAPLTVSPRVGSVACHLADQVTPDQA